MLDYCLQKAREIPVTQQAQRIYAVITDKRGNILAEGSNSYTKTHPRQAYYADRVNQSERVFLHAEIAALVKCRAEPYALYVARVGKGGESRIAKPCEICSLAIEQTPIKEVHYSV